MSDYIKVCVCIGYILLDQMQRKEEPSYTRCDENWERGSGEAVKRGNGMWNVECVERREYSFSVQFSERIWDLAKLIYRGERVVVACVVYGLPVSVTPSRGVGRGVPGSG